mgnify:CR=1 FL=1
MQTIGLSNIQKELPGAAILLSTNPDVLKRRRYLNVNNLAVRSILLEVAEANGVGYALGDGRAWIGEKMALVGTCCERCDPFYE